MNPPPTRRDVIARARAEGLRVAAVLPVHSPRALLSAYGFHPVEVWGPPAADAGLGNSHFQAYTCALVRNAISFLLSGALDDVDAIVVPHTCDAMQGLGSVLRDFVLPARPSTPPVVTFYLPRGRRDSDTLYLVEELKRTGRELSAISGRAPSEAEFLDAIAREEAADAAFVALRRERDRIALTDRDFHALLRTREYLGAAAFVEAARTAPRGASPARGVALMLSGIVPEPMSLFDEIADMGARVVADDMACLGRRVYPVFDEETDPWRRLARSLLAASPEPTLGSPIPERVESVRRRMEDSGARGLLVYDPKFCEPELFYLPLLRKGLEAAGLPLLHVEFEMSEALPAQTRTRIEAFIEMLRETLREARR